MKTKITKASVLAISQNQVSADLSSGPSGDVVIILDLKDGVYYELNETAARVWELIQQPCSVEVILNTLLEEYDVDARQCEADLLALTADMVKQGIVEITDGPHP